MTWREEEGRQVLSDTLDGLDPDQTRPDDDCSIRGRAGALPSRRDGWAAWARRSVDLSGGIARVQQGMLLLLAVLV